MHRFKKTILKAQIFLIFVVVAYMAISFFPARATSDWDLVGNGKFGGMEYLGNSHDLVIIDDTPYIAFSDPDLSDRVSVMTYTSGTWTNVGLPGISASTTEYMRLAKSYSSPGNLYIAYSDAANSGGLTIKEWNGVTWSTIGSENMSSGNVGRNFDMDTENDVDGSLPYVIYRDPLSTSGTRATVKKWNGTTWDTLGAAEQSTFHSAYHQIEFDGATPYISFVDTGTPSKPVVKSFNGTTWDTIGLYEFGSGDASYLDLALDTSGATTTPYVAFGDSDYGQKVHVMSYVSGTWTTVGLAGFSDNTSSNYQRFEIDSSGVPYITYTDNNGVSNLIGVKTYNGSSWVDLGTLSAFSDAFPFFGSDISINSVGEVLVSYFDSLTDAGVSVRVYSTLTRSLAYAGNFTEAVANDGSVDGSRVATLTDDTFVNAGSTLTEGTHFTLTNKPAGLTAVMNVNGGGTTATLTFTGNATNHANANDVSNLMITFLDSAFATALEATNVANYTDAVGTVDFTTYSASEFVTTWENPPFTSTSITIPTFPGETYDYDVDWDNDGIFDEFGLTGDVTHDYGVTGTYTVRIRGDFPRFYLNFGADRFKIRSVDQWGDQVWTSMANAFAGAYYLDISATDSPDLSSVTDMSFMFLRADTMNSDISAWDVSNVTSTQGMFQTAFAFNQDISAWDVSSVVDMSYMFKEASDFNQPLNAWGTDVSSVETMQGMFEGASDFNQDLNSWDVSSVTNMVSMFQDATSFNGSLSGWDVSSVTSTIYMFDGATSFNQPLNSWSLSSATSLYDMFQGAISFNQPLDLWETSSFSIAGRMFQGATSFDQDLGDWDVTSLSYADDMFDGVTLSQSNYDSLLIGWNAQVLNSGLTFSGGNSTYCVGSAARANMISSDLWTITDGGQDCASLSYSGNFTESGSNDGSVTGSRVATLTDDTFINAGSTLTENTHFTLTNKPAGITAVMTVNGGGTTATLTFTGNATNHADVNDVTDLTITFEDGAFTNTATASNVTNYTDANGSVDFIDPGTLSYSTATFTESGLNDGTISTTATLTLTGDTFKTSGGAMTISDDYTVANVPSGLTMVVTGTSGTTATVALTGTAAAHANANDISNMGLTFTNAAFTGGNAAGITGYANTGLSVDFDDPAVLSTDDFVTTWKTNNAGTSNSTSITIPTTGAGYSYKVDWNNDGDFTDVNTYGGGVDEATLYTGDVTFDFGVAGTYTIRITGDFPRIYFNNSGDKLKILDVDQWGNQVWTSMASAFSGAANLEVNATDSPDLSSVTDTSYMFQDAISFNQDISSWNVSGVTYMAGMFFSAVSFNQDISGWDVSSVTGMSSMFFNANSFDQPIGVWGNDTALVVNMGSMFQSASSFNQDISGWNTGSLTNTSQMFSGATSFNQDISSWDVSGVTDMSYMFLGAVSFNQPLNAWGADIALVTDMSQTFSGATSFNQDLSSWDMSSVDIMLGMFYGATSFDQDLGSWDVTSVTDATQFLDDVTLSQSNYDSLLIGWNAQTLQSGVTFSGGNSTYCAGSAARANMIASDLWTITDGGDGCVSVTYDTTTFSESGSNDGTITTTANITLTGDTFVAATSGAMTISTHYTVSNVPTGLTMVVTGTSNTTATVSLTGTAAAHQDADDISNMGLTFLGDAFTGGSAAAINGYSNTSLSVDFDDNGGGPPYTPPPVCSLSAPQSINLGSVLNLVWGAVGSGDFYFKLSDDKPSISNYEQIYHKSTTGITILPQFITQTTRFFFDAINQWGATTCEEEVEVIQPDPLMCTASFSDSSVTEGEETTLSWDITGGVEPYIDEEESSMVVVAPDLEEGESIASFTFDVSVTDSSFPEPQTAQCTADLEVVSPFVCNETTLSSSVIFLSDTTTLSWSSTGGNPPYDLNGESSPQDILGSDLGVGQHDIEIITTDNEGREAECPVVSLEVLADPIIAPETLGCTDQEALNYNQNANEDDNSCQYDQETEVLGCTDSTALNYNPLATENNNSCQYENIPVIGCMDPSALNYNPDATQNANSCLYPQDDPDIDLIDPLEPISPGDISDPSGGDIPTVDDTPIDVIGPTEPIIFRTVDIANFVDKPETKVGVAVALVVGIISAIAGAFAAPLAGSELLLLPARLWNLFLTALGLKKKQRPWGTVYDAKTKRPLDPVYVTLTNIQTGDEKNAITDMDGRYSFLIDQPGTYRISAKKKDYDFPSHALIGQLSDHLYQDLYFGAPFEVAEQGQIVTKNIPLDPTALNWNEQDKIDNNRLKFFKKRDYVITKIGDILFYLGFAVATLALIFFPAPYNIGTFALYIVFAVIKKTGLGGRPNGSVTDSNGDPVPYAILKLISPRLNQEIKHTVADKYGRYHLLANNGEYSLRVEEIKGEAVVNEITKNAKINKGYLNEKLKM